METAAQERLKSGVTERHQGVHPSDAACKISPRASVQSEELGRPGRRVAQVPALLLGVARVKATDGFGENPVWPALGWKKPNPNQTHHSPSVLKLVLP